MADAYASIPPDPALVRRTVGDVLRAAAARSPEHDALVEGTPGPAARRRLTYAQLLDRAEACARALLAHHAPGARIAILAPNVLEYQVLEYGCALAGMTLVTLNPTFRLPELRYALTDSGSAACYATTSFRGRELLAMATGLREEIPALERVARLDLASLGDGGDPARELPEVDPDAPFIMLYTSGTTGAPKGALLSHLSAANNTVHAAGRIVANGTRPPVWLASLPMFHLASCVVATVGTANMAGTVVTVPQFDAALGLELIEQERITTLNIVPTLMLAMLREPSFTPERVASMTSVMLGGTSIAPDLVRQVDADFGVVSIVGYGLTEAPIVTMTEWTDSPEDKADTCGLPLPGIEVRIVDPVSGAQRAFGEVGEVLTRGFNTLIGYHGRPEATAEALDGEGWLHTGDLGSLDARGYLSIDGRAKDMIIRGGENVYPKEIEDALAREPEIAEVAIVGLPDETYGEIVAAFLRTTPGTAVTAGELRARLREQMTSHKIPTSWFFLDDFPRTPSGKVQKFALRDAWSDGRYAEAAV